MHYFCKDFCGFYIWKLIFSDFKGKYVVLFFYPLDFTFVCPTEIIAFSEAAATFKKNNCVVLAASTGKACLNITDSNRFFWPTFYQFSNVLSFITFWIRYQDLVHPILELRLNLNFDLTEC